MNLILLLFWVHSLFAQTQMTHTKVEVLIPQSSLYQLEKTNAVIRFTPEPGWHIYWKNPGDSGLPPSIEWTMPEGISADPMLFPAPERINFGHLMNYGYREVTDFLVPLTANEKTLLDSNLTLKVNLKWLICKEECQPGKVALDVDVRIHPREEKPALEPEMVRLALSKMPVLLKPNAFKVEHLKEIGNKSSYKIEVLDKALKENLLEVVFFQETDEAFSADAPQHFKKTKDGIEISISVDEFKAVDSLNGVVTLRYTGNKIKAFEIRKNFSKVSTSVPKPEAPSEHQSLLLMLFFGFLGGLILNLMPCILPVLSIKVLELVNTAALSRKKILIKGFSFTLGVLISFWSLALFIAILKKSGNYLGWGFQLQSPVFVAGLAILFFLMALNLLGVFEFGGSLMQIASKVHRKEGFGHQYVEPFLSGVLTTLAATPCSAPFMGTALGFALSQNIGISLLVLTTLGLGLAFPYLCFSLFPSASRLLPKPGMWMVVFKEILAFPLLATVIWLVWVLSAQVNSMGVSLFLIELLGVVFLIWLLGLGLKRGSKGGMMDLLIHRLLPFGVLILMLFGLSSLSDFKNGVAASDDGVWKTFSEESLTSSIKQGKSVFIDFTANWCVTCKVNEKFVLSKPDVLSVFKKQNIVLMKGDWTSEDPKITSFLAKYGRNSVPVYLYYNQGSEEPVILPQILSKEIISKTIEEKK